MGINRHRARRCCGIEACLLITVSTFFHKARNTLMFPDGSKVRPSIAICRRADSEVKTTYNQLLPLLRDKSWVFPWCRWPWINLGSSRWSWKQERIFPFSYLTRKRGLFIWGSSMFNTIHMPQKWKSSSVKCIFRKTRANRVLVEEFFVFIVDCDAQCNQKLGTHCE